MGILDNPHTSTELEWCIDSTHNSGQKRLLLEPDVKESKFLTSQQLKCILNTLGTARLGDSHTINCNRKYGDTATVIVGVKGPNLRKDNIWQIAHLASFQKCFLSGQQPQNDDLIHYRLDISY